MGLLSQWRKKNDRYRKQSSPRTAYLPGNIEKSHFVYSPKLSARDDYLFRPSIQQLAQTFAIENLKKEEPTGLPVSSYYLDFPQISIKPHPDSPKQRPDSPEPRTGSLVLGTGSPELGTPEAINIKVIHVKPALDLWKNDESTGFKDDDNDESDLEKLVPSEVIAGPKGPNLINVKPVKDSMYLVQETDAEPNSQLTTYLSQVVDCDSGKVLEENLKKTSGCRLLDNNNRTKKNVSSDISTITLQESSFKPQAKPRPDTMFYVTRDTAWRGQSTSITDKKSKKKANKDKVTYTNIETLVEPKDEDEEEIKQKKNIFKRFYSRFAQHFR